MVPHPSIKKEWVRKEWPMCNWAITVSSFLFFRGQDIYSFNTGNIWYNLFSGNSSHSDCHRSNIYLFVRGFRSKNGMSSTEMAPSRERERERIRETRVYHAFRAFSETGRQVLHWGKVSVHFGLLKPFSLHKEHVTHRERENCDFIIPSEIISSLWFYEGIWSRHRVFLQPTLA